MMTEAFLGIDDSFSGKFWSLRPVEDRTARGIAQQLNAPDILGRVLAGRGVGYDDAVQFLTPTLRDLMPDPFVMQDMEAGAAIVADGIEADVQMAVFGDYDVDGATSSALLNRYFQAVGRNLVVYIPDRMKEGYGPNAAALQKLAGQGVELVITVDCGITAFDALSAGQAAGLETVVLDHHVAEPQLPPGAAIINPNRLDDESGLGQLAAVGVTFLFLVALNRELRQRNFFKDNGLAEPKLMEWLDIVALGTVCDVVPLKGLNRAFVRQGLKVLEGRRNAGLSALMEVAGVNETPAAYHLGFQLGPRVNAGGRVGNAALGAELLASDNIDQCRTIATQLDMFNRQRQEIEGDMLEQALAEAEAVMADLEEMPPALVFANDYWHAGVIGIVASRLKDRYDRPVVVIGMDPETGLGKGSGRSVKGVDLGAAVIAARQSGMLEAGGGHAMAAGLTIHRDRISDFEQFLHGRVTTDMDGLPVKPILECDGVLSPRGCNADLYDLLEQAGPWGAGHAEPRFVLPDVRLERVSLVGSNHVRMDIISGDGFRLKGISFRSADTPLGDGLFALQGMSCNILGKLKANFWQGQKRIEIHVEDAAAVAQQS